MLEVRGARLGYLPGGEPVLRGVDLSVAPGETVVLAGENGSGKSTLASLMCAMRLLSEGAAPASGDGAACGAVIVDGHDPAAGDAERLEVRRLVGFVRQNPYDQLVSTLVEDEVAFGPRNLGLDAREVASRVGEALGAVDAEHLRGRATSALSGGEQQRIALAGVLAMRPRYLVLDEVTSMLDASARPALRGLVARLASERSVGVVLISHDPVEAMGADRVAVLERGRIAWDGSPRDLLLEPTGIWDRTFLPNPCLEAMRAVLRARPDADAPLDPERVLGAFTGAVARGEADRALAERVLALLEGAGSGDRRPATGCAAAGTACADAPAEGRAAGGGPDDGRRLSGERPAAGEPRCGGPRPAAAGLLLEGVSFAYEPGQPVLSSVDLAVRPGEALLLAGRSGSGKSTLACIAAGLYEPDGGAVRAGGSPVRAGDVALAFQRPEDQLFLDTVADEVAFAPRNAGCDEAEVARRVRRACSLAGVPDELLDRYPFELSGGQARRVAIASVLSLEPGALVLDEPTAGLDARGRADAHGLVRGLAAEGLPVVVISHDLEEWIDVVDRVALIADGRVASCGPAPAAARGGCAPLSAAFSSCGLEPPRSRALARALRAAMGGGSL